MATNKRIQEKKVMTDAKQRVKDARFFNFHASFVRMKERQGWNYRKPGV